MFEVIKQLFNFAPLFTLMFNEKQIHIINTAERLFASKGYNGTSVRDIAEEAGVNLAMISYYFGSKEKLMQALFEHRTGEVESRVEGVLQSATLTPVQKMELLIDDVVDRISKKQQFHKIMTQEQMLKKNQSIIHLLRALKEKNAAAVERLVKEGQKKGVFKKNIDVVLLMNTIVGTAIQTFISQDFYKHYHRLQGVDQNAFVAQLKMRVSNHLKILFQAILVYEE